MIKRRQRRRWIYIVPVCFIAVVAGYVAWTLQRPLDQIAANIDSSVLTTLTTNSKVVWPGGVQAAVGVVDSSILDTNGAQTPLPTASTAKILTALVILNSKPLELSQPGPTITITEQDVARYTTYHSNDGSVVPVRAGEQLSEYQALQAIMLPSANNIADSLAIWAFGSLDNYKTAATAYLTAHNIENTHLGSDASGLDPGTISTAHDLVLLGELAMQNPVLAQIVGQKSVDKFPVAGTIKNVNYLLGTANIIGLKTGNSDQAGGVFVSASTTSVNGKPTTIVTALVGASNLAAAVDGSLPVVQSAQANFESLPLIKANKVIGYYLTKWGSRSEIVTSRDISQTVWGGQKAVLKKPVLSPIDAGVSAGTVVGKFPDSDTKLTLRNSIPRPTLLWRLTHPLS